MMKRTGLKALGQNFVLLLAACGMAFALGELVVRSLYKESTPLFPRYHTTARYGEYTLRTIRPDSVFTHTSADGSWEFVTNRSGFRNRRDFSYEKAEGVVRVLALGDSHTQGYEVRQGFTFSAVISKYLQAQGYTAEVINAGVSGFSTAEEVAFLENEGIRFDPDVVVVGFYANDYRDNVKAGLFRVDGDGELVPRKKSHIPGVRIQDIIYSVPLIPWMSENSYFYSLLFNNTWRYFKTRLSRKTRADVHEYAVATSQDADDYEVVLASALLKRLYSFCAGRGILLVLVDIPRQTETGIASSFDESMREDVTDLSDVYVDSSSLLSEYSAVAEIHRPNGQRHISEFTHIVLGMEAATAIGHFLEEDDAECCLEPDETVTVDST